MKVDLHTQITNRIIAQLEAGTVPWVKPWASLPRNLNGHFPHNAGSKRPYSGVNVVLLWMEAAERGYTEQGWLTYKQARELGAQVRGGERGSEVIFMKPLTVADAKGAKNEDGSPVTRQSMLMRSYTVFNVAQIDGLPAKFEPAAPAAPTSDELDGLARLTGARLSHGGDRAYYQPSTDSIVMPPHDAFAERANYRATLLHELGHWTGHKSRLNRDLRGRFGNQEYAAEELIAELCSAFQCAERGIDGDIRHAGYIATWLKALSDDKKFIFTASSAASKASTYINEAMAPKVDQVAA